MTQVYVALIVYVAVRLYQIIYETGRKWDLLRVFRHLQNTLSEELSSLEEAFWLSHGQGAHKVYPPEAERAARVYAAPNE